MNNQVKDVLTTLANKSRLTASKVVAVAANPASPLHPLFDWNDKSAAVAHRLEQARRLIREFTISVSVTPREESAVRAFVNVSHDRDARKEGVYEHRNVVLSDDAKRAKLVEQVLAQIERTLSLNADLLELQPIAQAAAIVRSSLTSVAAAAAE